MELIFLYVINIERYVILHIYLLYQLIWTSLCVGYYEKEIETILDDTLYKFASIWTNTSIDAWLTIIIYITIYIYYVGSDIKKYLAINLNICLIMITINIIGYNINRIDNQLTNQIDNMRIYPINDHPIAIIHPIYLLISIILIVIVTDNIMWICNRKNESQYNVIGSMDKIIKMLNIAIVLGGIWASTIFGWGGFWIWDQIECIIIIDWIIVVYCIHIVKNKYILFILTLYNMLFIIYSKTNIINSIHIFNDITNISINCNLNIWTILIIVNIIFSAYSINNVIINNNIQIIWKVLLIMIINNINDKIYNMPILIPINYLNDIIQNIIIFYILYSMRKNYAIILIVKEVDIYNTNVIIYKLHHYMTIGKNTAIIMAIMYVTVISIVVKKKIYNSNKFIHLVAIVTILIIITQHKSILELVIVNRYNEYLIIESNILIENINNYLCTLNEFINIGKKINAYSDYNTDNLYNKIQNTNITTLRSIDYLNWKENLLAIEYIMDKFIIEYDVRKHYFKQYIHFINIYILLVIVDKIISEIMRR